MESQSLAPSEYGHYEVEHLLGRGGIGTVYLARDRRIGRRVALKTIQIPAGHFSDDTGADEFFKRLQREAEVSGSLHHPNIVMLYDVGYQDGRVSWLAIELVEGVTLLELMKRYRPNPMPLETTLRVIEDVLRGLVHAHEKSIIHRDIKPANVLLTADGTAKVADFGIARPLDSSMTGAGSLIGTPHYMAPEQILGKQLTTRADLFSVGVLMYEMLAGTKPFVGDNITAVLDHILRQEVSNVSDVNPSVPRPIGDFVARLLSKSSDARPTAVEALAEVSAFRAQPNVAVTSTPKRVVVDPLRMVALVGAVVLILGGSLLFVRMRIDSSPTVTIPESQIEEFETKRKALAEAEAAYEAGRYEEAVQRYDDYLLRYPGTVPAIEGRERAQAALGRPQPQQKKPAARPQQRKRDDDISPSEMLKKIRKAITG